MYIPLTHSLKQSLHDFEHEFSYDLSYFTLCIHKVVKLNNHIQFAKCRADACYLSKGL